MFRKIENYFYETRPYAFLAIAFLAVVRAGESQLMRDCGILLLVAAVFVIHKRLQYRAIFGNPRA